MGGRGVGTSFIQVPGGRGQGLGCLPFDTQEIKAQSGQGAYVKPHSSKCLEALTMGPSAAEIPRALFQDGD